MNTSVPFRRSRRGNFSKRIAALLTVSLAISCSDIAETAQAAEEESSENADLIAKGKETYGMYCQACHGAEDAGIDSPSNLFDDKWYHGETRESVEATVREGVIDKGMPAWGPMISEEEIVSIIAYLFSFQNAAES